MPGATGDPVSSPCFARGSPPSGGAKPPSRATRRARDADAVSGASTSWNVRSTLAGNERLVAGEFWPAAPRQARKSPLNGVSRSGCGSGPVTSSGSTILGRAIEATVASVRSVDWTDARAGGFMFVFRPGVLESAPGTFIAPLKGPADAAARARFQRDLTAKFPNVSVIDVREILAEVTRVVRNVTLAVTVVGSVVLFSAS